MLSAGLQSLAGLPSDGPVPDSATQAVFEMIPAELVSTGMVIAVMLVAEFTAAVSVRVQVTSAGPAIGYGGAPATVQVQKFPGLVGALRMVMPAGMVSVTVTSWPTANATGPLLRGVNR